MPASPFAQLSDEDLMLRVARGDERAFAAFYDRAAGPLLALLKQMLGDTGEAEDCLQESFVYVWEKAGQFNAEKGRAFTWAVVVVRHRAIDRLRARQRRSRLAEQAAQELPALLGLGSELRVDEEVEQRERREQLARAVSHLPGEQRQLIECAFLKGLTHHAISESLGLPLGTVKTNIRRGLLKLREALKGGGVRA